MSVTLEEVIDRYAVWKIAHKKWRSHHSVIQNKSTLRTFAARVREIYGTSPGIKEIEAPLILKAIDRQWPENGKRSTHRVMTDRVKAFFNWAVSNGYCADDQVLGITTYRPEMPELDTKFATEEDIEKTFSTLTARGEYRDAYMIVLSRLFFRRGGEVVGIMVGDIDLSPQSGAPNGVYWFTEEKAHRGRQRIVLLKRDKEALEAYLKWYESEIGRPLEEDDFLFPHRVSAGGTVRKGEKRKMRLLPKVPITSHTRIYSEGFKEAGVYEWGKAGHACRRGGMDEAYEELKAAGYADPIPLIMQRSRHKKRETAERYIRKNRLQVESDEAFLSLDARRSVSVNPEPEKVSNVINFAELRRRRPVG
jgi:site-specific recombinase XerD